MATPLRPRGTMADLHRLKAAITAVSRPLHQVTVDIMARSSLADTTRVHRKTHKAVTEAFIMGTKMLAMPVGLRKIAVIAGTMGTGDKCTWSCIINKMS